MTDETEKKETIEQELSRILEIKPIKKKSRQSFLVRLVEAASELPDDKWESLSKPAATWVNKQREKLNADENALVDDFPDKVQEDVSEAKSEPEKEETMAKSATKSSSKKTTTKSASKSKSAANGSGEKPISAYKLVKSAIIRKPAMSVDDLVSMLEGKKVKPPSRITISTWRADTRGTMKMLVEAGKLDMEL